MSLVQQVVQFEAGQSDSYGADKKKQKVYHLDRQETDEGGLVRTNSTLSHDQRQLTQASQASQVTVPLKQNNCFPKLSFHVIGQQDSSYFINSNANVTSFKSNLLMFSQRCPSPEERLPQVLYEQPVNMQQPEQSIKKYTRRKSCQGGITFGEPSKQNIQRDKQFPLAIINMHLRRIIMEAEKKKKERGKEKVIVKQQSKRSFLQVMPKQQSFKITTGKSLFNSQLGVQGSSPMSPIHSPLLQGSQTHFGSGQNSATLNNQKFQIFNSQRTQEMNSLLEKKNQGMTTSTSPDKLFQQKVISSNEIQTYNKTNTLLVNQKINHMNSENSIQNKLRNENEDQQKEGTQNQKQNSKLNLEDCYEAGSLSKQELQSINSIKMDYEERKKETALNIEEDHPLSSERIQKDRPMPLITMSLSRCKQSDQDSNSSFSNSDIGVDDDGLQNDLERRSNASPLSKKKNSQQKTDRVSFSSKLLEGNEQENQKNVTFSNNQLPHNNYQQNSYQRQVSRFSVINVVAPTQQQQIARKQQLLASKTLQTSMSEINNEGQSIDVTAQKKNSSMTNNIKQIQENHDLQEVVQEYLEPGSTENLKYSPNNPSNRIGNMKKVFITATNWIALQNRVKANNTFYRNYYNLIGKVSVDNSIQYLSQMADDILSTPANRKVTQVFCAPKKRKVFIHNSLEDKVKLVTSVDKFRLSNSIQKYIINKQPNQLDSNSSKDPMSNTGQSSNHSQFYKASDYFHMPQSNKNLKTNQTNNSYNHQYSKSAVNQDYLLHENQNSINRRIQHLNEYNQKMKKKNLKLDSINNQSDLQTFFAEPKIIHKKQSSSTNNFFSNTSKKSSISFFDKLNNNSSFHNNITSLKAPLSPYLLPCTPNSTTNSRSKEIKTLQLQIQNNKKICETQRYHSSQNSLQNFSLIHNSNISSRKNVKNTIHS